MKRIVHTCLIFFVCLSLVVVDHSNTSASTTINFQNLVPPHFPGGEPAFRQFLGENLKWPKSQEDVNGIVVIGFNVEKDGILTGIKVVKSVSKVFDAEALRVLKMSPKWVPAKNNGVPINQNTPCL